MTPFTDRLSVDVVEHCGDPGTAGPVVPHHEADE